MKVITVILMLLPLLLAAQSYTLEELISFGLENSFSVQKSSLSYQSSRSMLNTSKWNLLPDASVTGGVNKDFDPLYAVRKLENVESAKANDLIAGCKFI